MLIKTNGISIDYRDAGTGIPVIFIHAFPLNQTMWDDQLRTMIEANSPVGIAGAQRGMAERRDSTYILPAIDFPTLILVGAEDTLTGVAEAEGLRAGIAGARLRVLEGAGHLSNLERPHEFNAALIEFIESLKAR